MKNWNIAQSVTNYYEVQVMIFNIAGFVDGESRKEDHFVKILKMYPTTPRNRLNPMKGGSDWNDIRKY